MKYLFSLTALILALACTKKADTVTTEENSSTTTTQSGEMPQDANHQPTTGANQASGTQAGTVVREDNKKVVKDEAGKVVREKKVKAAVAARLIKP